MRELLCIRSTVTAKRQHEFHNGGHIREQQITTCTFSGSRALRRHQAPYADVSIEESLDMLRAERISDEVNALMRIRCAERLR